LPLCLVDDADFVGANFTIVAVFRLLRLKGMKRTTQYAPLG